VFRKKKVIRYYQIFCAMIIGNYAIILRFVLGPCVQFCHFRLLIATLYDENMLCVPCGPGKHECPTTEGPACIKPTNSYYLLSKLNDISILHLFITATRVHQYVTISLWVND
jgi:hypothetical protein